MVYVQSTAQKNIMGNQLSTAELVKIRWPEGVECPRCQSKRVYNAFSLSNPHRKPYQLHAWRCDYCEVTFTVVTGTRLHGFKNVASWATAIRLLCQDPRIGAPEIARVAGVTRPTAYAMIQKIIPVMAAYFKMLPEALRPFYGKNLWRKECRVRVPKGELTHTGNFNIEKKVLEKLLQTIPPGGDKMSRDYATKGFSLDLDVVDALKKAAATEQRTLSNYVNRVLRTHFGLPIEEPTYAEKRFTDPAPIVTAQET